MIFGDFELPGGRITGAMGEVVRIRRSQPLRQQSLPTDHGRPEVHPDAGYAEEQHDRHAGVWRRRQAEDRPVKKREPMPARLEGGAWRCKDQLQRSAGSTGGDLLAAAGWSTVALRAWSGRPARVTGIRKQIWWVKDR